LATEIFRLFGSVFVNEKDATGSLSKIDEKGKGVHSTMGGMVAGAAKVGIGIAVGLAGGIAAIGAMVMKSADAAEGIKVMGEKYGMSTDKIQEMQYTSKKLGIEMDTFTGAQGKFTKAMAAGETATSAQGKAFKELGIHLTDNKGNLRDRQQVMAESIDALGKMTNETERDALSMKLFGKSALEMNPIIKAGGKALNDMAAEAHANGAVMSESSVNGLASFKENFEAAKQVVTGFLGELAGSLSPYLKKMQEWFTENMPMIKQKVTEAFEKIKSVIEPLLPTIGELIGRGFNALGNVLLFVGNLISVGTQFYKDHADVINTVAIIIGSLVAAIWLVTTAVSIWTGVQWLLNIAMDANPIGLIILAIAALIAIVVLLVMNWSSIIPFFQGLWDNVQAIFWGFIGFIQQAFWTAVGNIQQSFWGIIGFFQSLWGNIVGIFVGVGQAIGNAVTGAFKGAVNTVLGTIEGVINNFINMINGVIGVIKNIPGTDGLGYINTLQLPRLAKGGNITEGGRVVVGDGGNGSGTEIVDLPKGARVTPLGRESNQSGMPAIIINYPMLLNDQAVDELGNLITKHLRLSGAM
jgi:phage-related protein